MYCLLTEKLTEYVKVGVGKFYSHLKVLQSKSEHVYE